MGRFAAVALALVPLVAASSGCVWTSSSRLPSSEAQRLSRTEFVSRVEAACAKRQRAIAALRRPRAKQDRRRFFATVAAIEREEAQAHATLRAPEKDEKEFARFVAASSEVADVADLFLFGVARNDGHARRQALAAAERASAAYDRAARRLGLACRQSA